MNEKTIGEMIATTIGEMIADARAAVPPNVATIISPYRAGVERRH